MDCSVSRLAVSSYTENVLDDTERCVEDLLYHITEVRDLSSFRCKTKMLT